MKSELANSGLSLLRFKGKVIRYGTGKALYIPVRTVKGLDLKEGNLLTVEITVIQQNSKGGSEQ